MTETELYAADMFMPEILWSLYFIQAQGYEVECVGLYQDNISTQLLIKNRKMLSGKKTKHIKAKFFFIKDRLDNGEIKVNDCPTEEMWADIKPLQGTAFRVMSAELMNCMVNYEDPEDTELKPINKRPISAAKTVTWKRTIGAPFKTPQECVEQNGVFTEKPGTDRHAERSRRVLTATSSTLGGARLTRRTWQVGEARDERARQ